MKDGLTEWKNCIDNDVSIRITSDKQKARSLIETAFDRIEQINKDLNEKTANYIFEDYYTSIVEILEAIALLNGYKILNHVCLGFYLRDVLNKEDLYRLFNDLRFKRNSLVYYGKRMDFEIAKQVISNSKKLMAELDFIIKKYNLG